MDLLESARRERHYASDYNPEAKAIEMPLGFVVKLIWLEEFTAETQRRRARRGTLWVT